MPIAVDSDRMLIERTQRDAFTYFADPAHWRDFGVVDRSREHSPLSTAATGFGFAALAVGVEHDWIERAEAVTRIRTVCRHLRAAESSTKPTAIQHRGFFYHFLDGHTGERIWNSELSSIDTALLACGLLWSAAYFGDAELDEHATAITDAIDWEWMRRGQRRICHGWKPTRFMRYHWHGYNEALLLQPLALGSSTFCVPADCYDAWLEDYSIENHFGQTYLFCGPLFTHLFPLCFLDLRGRDDAFTRIHGFDYYENAERAVRVQSAYAEANPKGFAGYASNCFGVSASDGPPVGRRGSRRYYGYRARAVPTGPDDGTICAPLTAAALPCCPERVLPALHRFERRGVLNRTFNDTFPGGWVAPDRLAVDVGPTVLMLENFRSGMLWELGAGIRQVQHGLLRCGFGQRPTVHEDAPPKVATP